MSVRARFLLVLVALAVIIEATARYGRPYGWLALAVMVVVSVLTSGGPDRG